MVCASTHDSDSDSVTLIPAGVTVNNVDTVSGVEVVDGTLSVNLPDLFQAWSANIHRLSCDVEGDRQSRGQAQAADRDAEAVQWAPEPLRLPETKVG